MADRPVVKACTNCRSSKLKCDAERPCSRCVAHGKADSCVDYNPRPRGRKRGVTNEQRQMNLLAQANGYAPGEYPGGADFGHHGGYDPATGTPYMTSGGAPSPQASAAMQLYNNAAAAVAAVTKVRPHPTQQTQYTPAPDITDRRTMLGPTHLHAGGPHAHPHARVGTASTGSTPINVALNRMIASSSAQQAAAAAAAAAGGVVPPLPGSAPSSSTSIGFSAGSMHVPSSLGPPGSAASPTGDGLTDPAKQASVAASLVAMLQRSNRFFQGTTMTYSLTNPQQGAVSAPSSSDAVTVGHHGQGEGQQAGMHTPLMPTRAGAGAAEAQPSTNVEIDAAMAVALMGTAAVLASRQATVTAPGAAFAQAPPPAVQAPQPPLSPSLNNPALYAPAANAAAIAAAATAVGAGAAAGPGAGHGAAGSAGTAGIVSGSMNLLLQHLSSKRPPPLQPAQPMPLPMGGPAASFARFSANQTAPGSVATAASLNLLSQALQQHQQSAMQQTVAGNVAHPFSVAALAAASAQAANVYPASQTSLLAAAAAASAAAAAAASPVGSQPATAAPASAGAGAGAAGATELYTTLLRHIGSVQQQLARPPQTHAIPAKSSSSAIVAAAAAAAAANAQAGAAAPHSHTHSLSRSPANRLSSSGLPGSGPLSASALSAAATPAPSPTAALRIVAGLPMSISRAPSITSGAVGAGGGASSSTGASPGLSQSQSVGQPTAAPLSVLSGVARAPPVVTIALGTQRDRLSGPPSLASATLGSRAHAPVHSPTSAASLAAAVDVPGAALTPTAAADPAAAASAAKTGGDSVASTAAATAADAEAEAESKEASTPVAAAPDARASASAPVAAAAAAAAPSAPPSTPASTSRKAVGAGTSSLFSSLAAAAAAVSAASAAYNSCSDADGHGHGDCHDHDHGDDHGRGHGDANAGAGTPADADVEAHVEARTKRARAGAAMGDDSKDDGDADAAPLPCAPRAPSSGDACTGGCNSEDAEVLAVSSAVASHMNMPMQISCSPNVHEPGHRFRDPDCHSALRHATAAAAEFCSAIGVVAAPHPTHSLVMGMTEPPAVIAHDTAALLQRAHYFTSNAQGITNAVDAASFKAAGARTCAATGEAAELSLKVDTDGDADAAADAAAAADAGAGAGTGALKPRTPASSSRTITAADAAAAAAAASADGAATPAGAGAVGAVTAYAGLKHHPGTPCMPGAASSCALDLAELLQGVLPVGAGPPTPAMLARMHHLVSALVEAMCAYLTPPVALPAPTPVYLTPREAANALQMEFVLERRSAPTAALAEPAYITNLMQTARYREQFIEADALCAAAFSRAPSAASHVTGAVLAPVGGGIVASAGGAQHQQQQQPQQAPVMRAHTRTQAQAQAQTHAHSQAQTQLQAQAQTHATTMSVWPPAPLASLDAAPPLSATSSTSAAGAGAGADAGSVRAAGVSAGATTLAHGHGLHGHGHGHGGHGHGTPPTAGRSLGSSMPAPALAPTQLMSMASGPGAPGGGGFFNFDLFMDGHGGHSSHGGHDGGHGDGDFFSNVNGRSPASRRTRLSAGAGAGAGAGLVPEPFLQTLPSFVQSSLGAGPSFARMASLRGGATPQSAGVSASAPPGATSSSMALPIPLPVHAHGHGHGHSPTVVAAPAPGVVAALIGDTGPPNPRAYDAFMLPINAAAAAFEEFGQPPTAPAAAATAAAAVVVAAASASASLNASTAHATPAHHAPAPSAAAAASAAATAAAPGSSTAGTDMSLGSEPALLLTPHLSARPALQMPSYSGGQFSHPGGAHAPGAGALPALGRHAAAPTSSSASAAAAVAAAAATAAAAPPSTASMMLARVHQHQHQHQQQPHPHFHMHPHAHGQPAAATTLHMTMTPSAAGASAASAAAGTNNNASAGVSDEQQQQDQHEWMLVQHVMRSSCAMFETESATGVRILTSSRMVAATPEAGAPDAVQPLAPARCSAGVAYTVEPADLARGVKMRDYFVTLNHRQHMESAAVVAGVSGAAAAADVSASMDDRPFAIGHEVLAETIYPGALAKGGTASGFKRQPGHNMSLVRSAAKGGDIPSLPPPRSEDEAYAAAPVAAVVPGDFSIARCVGASVAEYYASVAAMRIERLLLLRRRERHTALLAAAKAVASRLGSSAPPGAVDAAVSQLWAQEKEINAKEEAEVAASLSSSSQLFSFALRVGLGVDATGRTVLSHGAILGPSMRIDGVVFGGAGVRLRMPSFSATAMTALLEDMGFNWTVGPSGLVASSFASSLGSLRLIEQFRRQQLQLSPATVSALRSAEADPSNNAAAVKAFGSVNPMQVALTHLVAECEALREREYGCLVTVLRPAGWPLYLNHKLADMLGYSHEELCTMSSTAHRWGRVYPADNGMVTLKVMQACFLGSSSMSARSAFINSAGERVALLETRNLVYCSLEEDIKPVDHASAFAAAATGEDESGVDFSSAGLPVLMVSYFAPDTDPLEPVPRFPTPLLQRPHVRSHFVPYVEKDHSLGAAPPPETPSATAGTPTSAAANAAATAAATTGEVKREINGEAPAAAAPTAADDCPAATAAAAAIAAITEAAAAAGAGASAGTAAACGFDSTSVSYTTTPTPMPTPTALTPAHVPALTGGAANAPTPAFSAAPAPHARTPPLMPLSGPAPVPMSDADTAAPAAAPTATVFAAPAPVSFSMTMPAPVSVPVPAPVSTTAPGLAPTSVQLPAPGAITLPAPAPLDTHSGM